MSEQIEVTEETMRMLREIAQILGCDVATALAEAVEEFALNV